MPDSRYCWRRMWQIVLSKTDYSDISGSTSVIQLYTFFIMNYSLLLTPLNWQGFCNFLRKSTVAEMACMTSTEQFWLVLTWDSDPGKSATLLSGIPGYENFLVMAEFPTKCQHQSPGVEVGVEGPHIVLILSQVISYLWVFPLRSQAEEKRDKHPLLSPVPIPDPQNPWTY